jgi:hypothetical protein
MKTKILTIIFIAASVACGLTFTQVASSDWRTASTWDLNSSYPQINDTAILVGGYTLANADSNNCRAMFTSGTSISNWAVITGPGALRANRQYVVNYLSDQRSGTLYADAQTNGKIKVNRCVYEGLYRVYFGLGGWGTGTDTVWVDSTDFRHLTATSNLVAVRGGTGDAYGYARFKNCTFDQTDEPDTDTCGLYVSGRNGFLFDHCVFANIGISTGPTISTAAPVYHSWNFYTRKEDFVPIGIITDQLFLMEPKSQSTHMANCYVYASHSNSHPVAFGTNSGTFDTLANCVFEVYTNISITNSGSNSISVGSGNLTIAYNISNGEAALVNNVAARTGDLITIKNNTILNKYNVTVEDPLLMVSESGAYTGSVIAYNNSVNSYVLEPCGLGAVSELTQNYTWSGHNTWEPDSLTSRYCKNTFTEDSTATDKSFGHCPIRDSSGTLSNWCVKLGGPKTWEAAVDTLLSVNGYNSVTKTQGASRISNINTLMGFVKAKSRQTAGYGQALGGGDFGAVPNVLTHKDTASSSGGDTLFSIDSVSGDLYISDYKRQNLDSVYVVTDTVRSGDRGVYSIIGPIKGGEKCTTKIAKVDGTLTYYTRWVGTEVLGGEFFTDTLAVDSVTYSTYNGPIVKWFFTTPYQKVKRHDSTGTDSYSMNAVKNEFESFQISLRSPEVLDSIDVTIDPFSGDSGIIDSSLFYVYLQRYMYCNPLKTGTENSDTGWIPDILCPKKDPIWKEQRNFFPCSLYTDQTQPFFFDIWVPDSIKNGIYVSTIKFTYKGDSLVYVPCTLKVNNFSLPESPTFKSAWLSNFDGIRYGHYATYPANSTILHLRHMYAKQCARNRMQVPPLPPTISSWNGETYTTYSATNFNSGLGVYSDTVTGIEYGKQTPSAFVIDLTAIYMAGITCDNADTISTTLKHQFYEYAKKLYDSIPDYRNYLYLLPLDEPGGGLFGCPSNRDQDYRGSDSMAVQIHNAGLKTTVTKVRRSELLNDGINTYWDRWIVSFDAIERRDYENYNVYINTRSNYDDDIKAGAQLWWYQSCMTHGCSIQGGEFYDGFPQYLTEYSAIDNMKFQLMSFKQNIQGELYWGITNYYNGEDSIGTGDPWKSTWTSFTGYGEGGLFYPGVPDASAAGFPLAVGSFYRGLNTPSIGGTNHTAIESFRVKMIREGNELHDLCYILDSLGRRSYAQTMVSNVITNSNTSSSDPSDYLDMKDSLISKIEHHLAFRKYPLVDTTTSSFSVKCSTGVALANTYLYVDGVAVDSSVEKSSGFVDTLTVTGLNPLTTYDFQIVRYDLNETEWDSLDIDSITTLTDYSITITADPVSDTTTSTVRMWESHTGDSVNVAWYRFHGSDTILMSRDSVLQFTANSSMHGDSLAAVLYNNADTVMTAKAGVYFVYAVFDSVNTTDSNLIYVHGNFLAGTGWTATLSDSTLTTESGSATNQVFGYNHKITLSTARYELIITNGTYTVTLWIGRKKSTGNNKPRISIDIGL